MEEDWDTLVHRIDLTVYWARAFLEDIWLPVIFFSMTNVSFAA